MAYSDIETISAQRQYGNSGRQGWGFVMSGDFTDNVDQHRRFLERLGADYQDLNISLPEYETGEDYIRGAAVCGGATIEIYYENLLNYLEFWSEDHDAVTSFRAAVLRVAR